MSKETDEWKASEARELLERVATALPVLEAMLKKAAELTRANHDMGARRARDMFAEVREFLRPKEVGRMVVSGVHPDAPHPRMVPRIVKSDPLHVAELMDTWPKGCAAPSGYVEWHNWAEAQDAHGLKQTRCGRCHRYYFPQEKPEHMTCSAAAK